MPSLTVPYPLLIVGNKRISFATGVPEETEKLIRHIVILVQRKGTALKHWKLLEETGIHFEIFCDSVRFKKKTLHLCNQNGH